jgi:hypothetical protein
MMVVVVVEVEVSTGLMVVVVVVVVVGVGVGVGAGVYEQRTMVVVRASQLWLRQWFVLELEAGCYIRISVMAR